MDSHSAKRAKAISTFHFGTVGAPKSTPKKPGGSVGAVQRLAELGLGAFELGWVQSVRVGEDACLAIKVAAAEAGVAVSVHAPYYINLNASKDEWPRSRKRLMDAAYFGHLAGATDIVFHPGSYFDRPREQVLEIAIRRLRQCVEELRAHNNPVVLRPETMGKSAMIGSLEDVILMAQEVEGVEPCLDFAHLHARAGDGTLNSYKEWSRLLKQYRKSLGARALRRLHSHLSGIVYSTKGERNHVPLAESDLDLHGLLQALRDAGCSGRILCESPILEQDALVIQQAWQGLNAMT
ncbi:MAG: TIM barrel protein [Chloroflexota bacterium]